MSIRNLAKQILVKKENMRYRNLISRRQMTYEQWSRERETNLERDFEKVLDKDLEKDRENSLVFRCFVVSEGECSRKGLSLLAQSFRQQGETMLLYGDEDVEREDVCVSPWFKADWSPELWSSYFYFGSVVAIREVGEQRIKEKDAIPFYRELLGQDHYEEVPLPEQNAIARVVRTVNFQTLQPLLDAYIRAQGAYGIRNHVVSHVSEILFHSVSEQEQKKFFEKKIVPVGKRDLRKEKTILSVVIPSKDHPELLKQCLGAWVLFGTEQKKEEVVYPSAIEFVIVDNGSTELHQREISQLLEEMENKYYSFENTNFSIRFKYVYEKMEFHFSKMCNLGAHEATGEILLFLNDDVEMVSVGSISQMLALVEKPWIGAVGLKLRYPGTDSLQHAGITNLPMGPVHKLQFLSDEEEHYFYANRGLRNVMAVTGACLMVERMKFEEIHGFSEELPVAFNDVDLCFSFYEKGYYNVCVNEAFAYHHESLSRGDDESEDKRERLLQELDKLYERHPSLRGVDPYYSKHLNREGLDVRIRPAYETSRNRRQVIEAVSSVKGLSRERWLSYREDACVLFRVESIQGACVQGYSVVLGDDNACYERKLILIPSSGTLEQATTVYAVTIEGQYRPDLEENMKDQRNVGLCGIWIELLEGALAALPQGRYQIAVGVRNRVTGLKLYNRSNCYFYKEL